MDERQANETPWPSTYRQLGQVTPKKITNKYPRIVSAFRVAIPPRTTEPPQIHLNASRDGLPLEEILTDFDLPFTISFYNLLSGRRMARVYNPGEDIIIPRYVIHWLINDNDSPLEFTCEYAPHPWDENDEPEFRDVTTLLNFVNKEGLKQQVLNARIPY